MNRTKLFNRDFCLYWSGLAAASLGDAFMIVALPFLVLDASGDPKSVAFTLLLSSLPRFAGPLLGALADRWPLRLPLTAAGIVRALLFGGLGALAVAGTLPLTAVYGAALVNGLVTTFAFAAGNVAMPALVPRDRLARANALIQAALMGVPLIGLGVAGALVGTVGPAGTILVGAPLLGMLGVCCAFVRFPPRASTAAGEAADGPGSLLAEVTSGAAYLFRAGPLGLVFPLSLLINAGLMLSNALVPVIMDRSGHGAVGFGMYEALASAGILAGIVAVSVIGPRLAPQHAISWSFVGLAGGFALISAGPLTPMLAGSAVLGLGIGFTEVAAITLLQLAVPDGMRGKVMGAIFTANAAGQSLGAAFAAPLADGAPTGPVFLAAAGVMTACAIAWIAGNRLGRERLDTVIARSVP